MKTILTLLLIITSLIGVSQVNTENYIQTIDSGQVFISEWRDSIYLDTLNYTTDISTKYGGYAANQGHIFYVDSINGSDLNNGLSEATAWQTIDKVNNYTFSEGDVVLFKGGNMWRELLTVPSSSLKIGAYGNIENLPIINAANIVTGWSSDGADVIANGDIESWASSSSLNDWATILGGGSTLAQEATEVHGGTYSVKMSRGTGNCYLRQLAVPLDTGVNYNLTVWIKSDGTNTVYGSLVDVGNNTSLVADGTWGASSSSTFTTSTSASWTRHTLTFTSHASYTSFNLNFYAIAGTFDFYIDDVSIIPVSDELVVNGDFADSTNNWLPYAATSLLTIDSEQLVVTIDGYSTGYAYQSFTTEVGETYICSGSISNITNRARITIGTSRGSLNLGYKDTGVDGWYTFEFTPTTTTTYVSCFISGDAESAYFDNISVRKKLTSNVWYAVHPHESATTAWKSVCVIDDTMQTVVDDLSSVEAGKFYIGGEHTTVGEDTLYIWSDTDPSTKVVETTARTYAIFSNGKSDFEIKNIEVRYANIGMFTQNSGGEGASISNCYAYHNRGVGIYTYGGVGGIVSDCKAEYNTAQFYTRETSSQTFVRDTATNTIGVTADSHAFGAEDADNTLFEYCYADGGVGAYTIDMQNNNYTATIRYCKSYNSEGANGGIVVGYVGSGGSVDIYYNLIVNGEDWGFRTAPSIVGSVNLYNNTFYHATGGGILNIYNSNINLKNNIVYSTTSGTDRLIESTSNYTFTSSDYNQFYKPNQVTLFLYDGVYYETLPLWVSGTGFDVNSNYGNPLFTDAANDDFTLQTGSPAINAGVDVGLTKDIEGNTVPSDSVSIGAYQYIE